MTDYDARQFAIELARIAHDSKTQGVVALDLRGISHVMDFTVLGTGTSPRQMRAVADQVIAYARKLGQRPFGCSGYGAGAWIVVDFVDVVFHVFDRQAREYYDLELLWGDAPRVQWARSESA